MQVHTLQIKLNGSLRGTTESLPVGELLEQRENIYVGSIKGTHEKIGKGNPPTPKSYVIEGIETELIE